MKGTAEHRAWFAPQYQAPPGPGCPLIRFVARTVQNASDGGRPLRTLMSNEELSEAIRSRKHGRPHVWGRGMCMRVAR